MGMHRDYVGGVDRHSIREPVDTLVEFDQGQAGLDEIVQSPLYLHPDPLTDLQQKQYHCSVTIQPQY